MEKLRLDNTIIDENSFPYIIAEIGVNHEGSLEKAKKLIDLAKKGGANAAKFQAYKADSLASVHSPAYWDKSVEPIQSQYALYKTNDSFGQKEFSSLNVHCKKKGIDFLCTPFDITAVDYLDPLVPYFKVASSDITNIPLLRKISSKGKPIVLSTGASTLVEIDLAISEMKKHGAKDICLLHCIINYPTEYKNANLNMIQGLVRTFPEYVIGYSDHTIPDPEMIVLTTAYLKGAMVIEKHFTDDKTLHGNDHFHAMDVNDLKKFVSNVSFIKKLNGSNYKKPLLSEEKSRLNARRSIVLVKSIKAGHKLIENDLISKRPAYGISPICWDEVIGMKAKHNLDKNHVLQWPDLIK